MAELENKEIFRQERYLLIDIITKYLSLVFFKKDRSRAIHWIITNNSNFSNASPKELILNGRASKVWQFIQNAQYDQADLS